MYASGFIPFAPRKDSLASQMEALRTPKPQSSIPSQSEARSPGMPSMEPVYSTPQILINCLRNNIFIVASSAPGRTLFKLSSGIAGFHGGQKTSHKAALALLDVLYRRLTAMNIQQISLNFRGINAARGIMVGQLRSFGLQITEICETTRVPFNGCRPPKKRRL